MDEKDVRCADKDYMTYLNNLITETAMDKHLLTTQMGWETEGTEFILDYYFRL